MKILKTRLPAEEFQLDENLNPNPIQMIRWLKGVTNQLREPNRNRYRSDNHPDSFLKLRSPLHVGEIQGNSRPRQDQICGVNVARVRDSNYSHVEVLKS